MASNILVEMERQKQVFILLLAKVTENDDETYKNPLPLKRCQVHKINKIIGKPEKKQKKHKTTKMRKGKALQLRLSSTPRAAGYKGS